MKRYVDVAEGQGVLRVVGDVCYDRPRGIWKILDRFCYTDLAYVTYKHPDGNAEDGSVRFVEKRIRTYHPYHREIVSVLVLKDLPLSGQEMKDVERDVASFQR